MTHGTEPPTPGYHHQFSIQDFGELEDAWGLPRGILKRVYGAESSYGADLSTSKAGAKGHFQFIDETAKEYGVHDPMNLEQSARGAAHYLHDLHEQLGSWDAALAGYNWGPGNVRNAMDRHGDRWRAFVPRETAGYLRKTSSDTEDPIAGNDRVRFSAYAVRNAKRQPNTEVAWMRPQDYLDLSPEFGADEARNGKQWQSLSRSLASGDDIEELPGLEIVHGPDGAKVVDQDGRHRALAAQDAGLEAIPVAVRHMNGKKKADTLEGMSGKVLPFDFDAHADAPEEAPAKPPPYDIQKLVETISHPVAIASQQQLPQRSSGMDFLGRAAQVSPAATNYLARVLRG